MIGNKFLDQKRSGFTLMEMMVAVFVFSLTIAAAVTVFVASNQVQKRVANLQEIDQQVKYLLEFFVNNVKQADLDYVTTTTNPYLLSQSQLFNFLTKDKDYVSWRLLSASSTHVWQQCERIDRFCTAMDPDSDWFDLHSRSIDFSVVGLVMNPLLDPWQINESGAYLSNEQPIVTLLIAAKKAYSSDMPTIWQTSIASRLYKR